MLAAVEEAAASGPTASKVIAVHLNYRSRARERGRTPSEPSYFLKPPSSISTGGELVQPQGTELLTYEGEVAIIIGKRGRDISREQAREHIGAYAPANDFGVHDFRWADRGSNFLAKGQDGYTPIGPRIDAQSAGSPPKLRLRTYVNGELRQDTADDELIFTPADLVADLSRFVTLEVGDVILTGTPTGTGVVGPGDVIEVSLDGAGPVSTTVVAAQQPLRPYGAMPRATAAARAYATGASTLRPLTLSADAHAMLQRVSTATLTVNLAKQGVHGTFLTGLRPSRPDLRMVGYARTLRYVAFRADVREADRGREDAQKRIVESVNADDVLMMDARGVESAGTFGDIRAARVLARGGVGIVTDGGVRDTPGVGALALPTYYRSAAAPSLWTAHIPIDIDLPITCAGALVMPGDVVVGDGEGAIILPAALAERVAHDSWEQEQREAWSLERVQAGESIRGVYPISQERMPDYQRWLAARSQKEP
ncbi:MAG: fumarylacetoacetate hydrolase family protein [Solirubrobacteraceae bacterium]